MTEQLLKQISMKLSLIIFVLSVIVGILLVS